MIREATETTRTCIVYNPSGNTTSESPSLNKCLYLVLPLYNKLWDVLVRQRAYLVVVTADIKRPSYRSGSASASMTRLRFTGRKASMQRSRCYASLVRCLASPRHPSYCPETDLNAWEKQEIGAGPRRALHIDDLMTGGRDCTQAKERREKTVKIIRSATFEIHQWNSNVEHLEEDTKLAKRASLDEVKACKPPPSLVTCNA